MSSLKKLIISKLFRIGLTFNGFWYKYSVMIFHFIAHTKMYGTGPEQVPSGNKAHGNEVSHLEKYYERNKSFVDQYYKPKKFEGCLDELNKYTLISLVCDNQSYICALSRR